MGDAAQAPSWIETKTATGQPSVIAAPLLLATIRRGLRPVHRFETSRAFSTSLLRMRSCSRPNVPDAALYLCQTRLSMVGQVDLGALVLNRLLRHVRLRLHGPVSLAFCPAIRICFAWP